MLQRFWTTREMVASGWNGNGLAAAVRSGGLLRPRIGRYCPPRTDDDLVRAVRIGGVVTAGSAARLLELWAPQHDLLQVAVPLNSPRLRDPDTGGPWMHRTDVVLHWEDAIPTSATPTGIAPIELVLKHAFDAYPPEFALAMLDSALRLRHLRQDRLAVLLQHLRPDQAAVARQADARAGSGIESIVRHRLRSLGLRVEVQLGVRGVGSVDLVVEGRLIIEPDGREFHVGDQFFEDRRRDLASTTERFRVLRLIYRQILEEWSAVEAAVFAALAA